MPLELRGLNQEPRLQEPLRHAAPRVPPRHLREGRGPARHLVRVRGPRPPPPRSAQRGRSSARSSRRARSTRRSPTRRTCGEGALWFVEGVVRDGSGTEAGRRVFALLQTPEGEMRTLNPAVLWDLEPVPGRRRAGRRLLSRWRTARPSRTTSSRPCSSPTATEIEERRERDVEIKERYGLRSLDYLIQESNGKILEYEMRSAAGEDMEIATRNERRNLDGWSTAARSWSGDPAGSQRDGGRAPRPRRGRARGRSRKRWPTAAPETRARCTRTARGSGMTRERTRSSSSGCAWPRSTRRRTAGRSRTCRPRTTAASTSAPSASATTASSRTSATSR